MVIIIGIWPPPKKKHPARNKSCIACLTNGPSWFITHNPSILNRYSWWWRHTYRIPKMFRSVKPLFFSHPQWVDEAPFFSPCATQFTAVQGVTGMTWLQLEQIVQVSDFLAIWWGSRHVGPTRFLQQKKCQPFGKWVASVEVTAASSNLGERKAGKKCCSSNSSCGGRRRFKTLRTQNMYLIYCLFDIL